MELIFGLVLICAPLPAQSVAPGWTRYVFVAGITFIEAGATYHDVDAGGDVDSLVRPYNHATPSLHILLNQAKGR